MIPCLTIAQDQEDIAAQHLVCSHLVRACREAMYELALDDPSEPRVRQEAIRLLKIIHEDWLQARRALAAVVSQPRLFTAPPPARVKQTLALTEDNK